MKKKSMLIVAILLMSIGFAAISTTLIINGNAKVSENNEDFSVIFTAASLDGKDVYSSVVDETKKIITFETSELKTLNQTSILTYEVTNNSSNYDAEVKVTCIPKTGTTAKYTSIKNKLDNDETKVLAKESLNGTLTITLDQVATETVTEEYTCKLEFNAIERDTMGKEIPAFQKDDWATIAANVHAGNTNQYNVGDIKTVDLGTFGTHTVRVANKSECTNGETSETACGFIVEFADVIISYNFNSEATNLGGWRDSKLRTYTNDTIYNMLPSELQTVISSTKVISGRGSGNSTNLETQDKLYLLSAEEVFGSNSFDKAVGTSKQLDYYKNQGVTTSDYEGAKKQYNKSTTWWWLRSARSLTSDRFLVVKSDGELYGIDPRNDFGVSPAFRIA